MRTLAQIDREISECEAILRVHNMPPSYDNDGNVVMSGGTRRQSYEHRLVRLLVERNDLLRVIGNPVRVTDVTLPNTAN